MTGKINIKKWFRLFLMFLFLFMFFSMTMEGLLGNDDSLQRLTNGKNKVPYWYVKGQIYLIASYVMLLFGFTTINLSALKYISYEYVILFILLFIVRLLHVF